MRCMLDALVAKGQCANERIIEGKQMLVRIVSMLSKLVDRFNDQNNYVREESGEYEDA